MCASIKYRINSKYDGIVKSRSSFQRKDRYCKLCGRRMFSSLSQVEGVCAKCNRERNAEAVAIKNKPWLKLKV